MSVTMSKGQSVDNRESMNGTTVVSYNDDRGQRKNKKDDKQT